MGEFSVGRGTLLGAMTVLALVLSAAMPAISRAAAAQTYCVHQAGFTCPAGTLDEGDDFQQALTDAGANPSTASSPNVITVAPGTYQPSSSGNGFTVSASNPVQIVGAGIGLTTLTDTGALAILQLQWPAGSSISDLTVSGSDQSGLEMSGGTADQIAVDVREPLAIGVGLNDGALEQATISLPPGGITGVETNGGAGTDSNEIDDVTVQGGGQSIQAYAGTTIHRAKLTATGTPLQVFSASAYIDDSLLIGSQGIGLQDDSSPGSVTALNDTIVAEGNPTDGVTASANGSGATDARIINSIVRGFPTSFSTSGLNGGEATIDGSDVSYAGASSGSGISVGPTVSESPDFVNPGAGDYRLQWDSPLIDASSVYTLGSGSTTDLDGNPRLVSYTHASTPIDIGAYEYQHRAPIAVASAAPSSAMTGTAITFDGSRSSDPDDGDTVTYAWSFDDGATASGATVTHAFSTPGPHTATLTVTDSTGLTSKQDTAVSVAPPPAVPTAPTPTTPMPAPLPPAPLTPSSPAPPRLTVVGKPSVKGDKVTLKLSCTGTTACSGIHVGETTIEKQKARKRSVQVASATLRLNPGQTRTITVTLTGKGRGMLKRVGKLPVTITVTMTSAGKKAMVRTAHATLHLPKKPHPRS